jgi:tetratricopeptide (TPR) repeat protein
MSTNTAESYLKHPLYKLALLHLQQGEWTAGMAEVEHLMEIYPLERELRSLRADLNLRARLDRDERIDTARSKRRRFRILFTRAGAISVFILVAFWGFRTYSNWLGGKLNLARQKIQYELQIAELSAQHRDAQALLKSGRTEEALSLLEGIAQAAPDLPGLDETLLQIELASTIESQYAEAMHRAELQDWLTAYGLLTEIAAINPNYRDVQTQLEMMEVQLTLENIYTQAEEAYRAELWEDAVTAFESLRSLSPDFKPELLESRLFTSYVNAARGVLVGQSNSLEALGVAESYFRKALALRPQDPEIKIERELARLYLKAQDDFNYGRMSEVITSLEVVHNHDPHYASGTARQTLYDAYVARGDVEMKDSNFEAALSDYQRAITLAEQEPDVLLRIYEAHLKAGEALGLGGNFEAAVLHYRSAAEMGGLYQIDYQENPSLVVALQEADQYVEEGNFSMAFERYNRALRLADTTQETVIHVVKEGEYLTMLASQYGSTVQAIALANNISNTNLIYPGQEIIIPVLP